MTQPTYNSGYKTLQHHLSDIQHASTEKMATINDADLNTALAYTFIKYHQLGQLDHFIQHYHAISTLTPETVTEFVSNNTNLGTDIQIANTIALLHNNHHEIAHSARIASHQLDSFSATLNIDTELTPFLQELFFADSTPRYYAINNGRRTFSIAVTQRGIDHFDTNGNCTTYTDANTLAQTIVTESSYSNPNQNTIALGIEQLAFQQEQEFTSILEQIDHEKAQEGIRIGNRLYPCLDTTITLLTQFGTFNTNMDFEFLQKKHINGLLSDLGFARSLIMFSEECGLSEELTQQIQTYIDNHANRMQNALERYLDNINASTINGASWLDIATMMHQFDIIPLLLEQSRYPNGTLLPWIGTTNDDSYAPIHRAAIFGSIPLLNTLLKASANINLPSSQKHTALQLALIYQQPKAAHFLVSKDAHFSDEEMDIVTQHLEVDPDDEEYKALKNALDYKKMMKNFGIKVCVHTMLPSPTFPLADLTEQPRLPEIQNTLTEIQGNNNLTQLLNSQGVFANVPDNQRQLQILRDVTNSSITTEEEQSPKRLTQ